MSIQQEINSSLGQVGVLAALNPTLQAKAKEGEELRKIKRDEETLTKRAGYLKEEIKKDKEKSAVIGEALKKMTPEEVKFNGPEMLKSLNDLQANTKAYGSELEEITDKEKGLIRKGYNISPEKYWVKYSSILKREAKEEIAEAAIQRAQEQAATRKANRERRTKLLYGEMERMMPGFKYMEPKKQNKIIKDLGPDERKRIKDEAERREKYYGK